MLAGLDRGLSDQRWSQREMAQNIPEGQHHNLAGQAWENSTVIGKDKGKVRVQGQDGVGLGLRTRHCGAQEEQRVLMTCLLLVYRALLSWIMLRLQETRSD